MKLDWNEYLKTAEEAVAEGIVLVKNDRHALPLEAGTKLAVFGRMQNYYYKSGTGSGGMVNVTKVWGILDALKACPDLILNEKLMQLYQDFDATHPYEIGVGFGNEPWSQVEMPIEVETIREAARESDAALVILARTAGEEQDNVDRPGAYRLSETELAMLSGVREAFDRVIVVLNVGNVMDMNDLLRIGPDAIAYVWQGGMQGGLGTVDVLTGRVSPSGRLTDTIAGNIADYPATPHFGDDEADEYVEDIYVGYRYFDTFAKDKVLYPFGYGLSYTAFTTKVRDFRMVGEGKVPDRFVWDIEVTNVGACPGKEVVQVYAEKPQGRLGNPARVLSAYGKSKMLAPGESDTLTLTCDSWLLASYDDAGLTGAGSAYVFEAGNYRFVLAENALDSEAQEAGSWTLDQLVVYEQLRQALAPIQPFHRMRPVAAGQGYEIGYEAVPVRKVSESEHRLEGLPKEIAQTGDRGIKLVDVRDGRASMEAFVGQIADEDLAAIIRGEGMGSPKVTPGTAAAFGGVTKNLKNYGVPCGCCSDGPSGMRLDSGSKAFSLPNGTLLACTFNDVLNERLYGLLGMEMTKNKVDCLLGPGMNLHRHPLNGRNFEYFSEDPLLTGKMAAAQIRGLHSAGVTGTLKHFCGNNQEHNRHSLDSIISERALREIYLRGFEIAVKEGGADSVMTTYGAVNGTWTNSSYDLCTEILRKEWHFRGIVMTDWWSDIGTIEDHKKQGGENYFAARSDFATLVRAQNDFYAVCPDASVNSTGDNTLSSLAEGSITRGELQRIAANICGFLMKTNAMKRFLGEDIGLEVINYTEEEETFDADSVEYYEITEHTVIDLSGVDTTKGRDFVFGVDATLRGGYKFVITGSSELSELSQIPVSLYFQSIHCGTFTWNGTGGQWVGMERKMLMSAKYGVVRLHFGASGLKLKDIELTFEKPIEEITSIDEYMYG